MFIWYYSHQAKPIYSNLQPDLLMEYQSSQSKGRSVLKYYCFILPFVGIALIMPPELGAQTPTFRAWEYVRANGSPILLSIGHVDPCVVDWDGDGMKDLLVGQFSGGKIRFYKNTGTNCYPVFTTYTYLKADGVDITLPSG
jgi:hypothetical protein